MEKVKIQIPVEFKRLFDRDWREAAVWGGRFSLKSHTVARLLLIRARLEKTRIACFREFQNSIADSSLQLLADLIKQYELSDFVVTDNAIINKVTGSDFIFKGLHRNEQSIKSIEGVDLAWCFIAGTKIDGKNIEKIKKGDLVRSYNHKTNKIEYKKVLKTFKRKTPSTLIRLISHGANDIITTKEHPVFVKNKGYVKAKNLQIGDIIFYDQKNTTRKTTLFGKMWGLHRNKYQRKTTKSIKKWWSILLGLCQKKNVGTNENQKSNDGKRNKRKNEKISYKYKTQTNNIRRQWQRFYKTTKFIVQKAWKRLVERTCGANKSRQKFNLSNELQNRFSKYLLYVGNRMRWICTSWRNWKSGRSEEKSIFRELRVDDIKVQKQTDLKQYGLSDEGNYVYNIEVEINNNYFANGILVHNCEESQTLSQNSLEILTPTIRKPGSQIIYTYNRLFEDDPVHVRLVVEGRPNTLLINVNYDTALKYGFMPESVRLEMEDDKAKRPQLYKHKWLGEPNTLEARIFKDWAIVDSVPHEARLERYGLDFGYSNDPTALIAVYYYNGGYIIDEILYRKGMLNKMIADVIMAQPKQVLVKADSAEPKSIAEIASYGVIIAGSKKGKDSVDFGIQWLQDQRLSVTKRSLNVIKEYKAYMFDQDNDGRYINKPIPGNDHAMDALRYAFDDLIFKEKERKVPRYGTGDYIFQRLQEESELGGESYY